MNVVVPSGTQVWGGIKNFFTGLGVIPSIILIVVVGLILWSAWSGITDSFDRWNTNRQIENLKEEADALRKERDVAVAEKEQYKGAAAAYQQQATEVQDELTELFNVRPDLQRQVTSAGKNVEAIRNRPTRPVTDDMRQRVSEFGAKLDQLYP